MTSIPLFTFDDGNSSDLWAANVLREHGHVGVFFLNDHADLSYVVPELLKMGMIVGNHTASHPWLSRCTQDQIFLETVTFNKKLTDLGASGEWFSYPYSNRPFDSQLSIIKDNFKYVFKGYDEPSEPGYQWELARVSVIKDGTVKDENRIRYYLANGTPLQLHGIDTGGPTAIPRNLFIRLCKSLSPQKI